MPDYPNFAICACYAKSTLARVLFGLVATTQNGCCQPFRDSWASCDFRYAARAKHKIQLLEGCHSKGDDRPDRCCASNQWLRGADTRLCKVWICKGRHYPEQPETDIGARSKHCVAASPKQLFDTSGGIFVGRRVALRTLCFFVATAPMSVSGNKRSFKNGPFWHLEANSAVQRSSHQTASPLSPSNSCQF